MQLSDGAEQRSSEILNHLSEDDQKMLIRLPFRVGLYISNSDLEGGSDANEAELLTLTNILMGVQEDFLKSEIMQKIMMETVAHKDDWPKWGENLNQVPEECVRVHDLLITLVDQPGDLMSVKETLMDIGIAVAMAFREVDEDPYAQDSVIEKLQKRMTDFIGRVTSSEKEDERFNHLNISPKERVALIAIHDALSQ